MLFTAYLRLLRPVLSPTRRSILLTAVASVIALGPSAAQGIRSLPNAAPIKVVASFSVLGDMVREIGGRHVALTTLVGADGDAHSFEPSPKDAQALGQAQVLVLNGLDFEGWLPRLLEAADFKGVQILASEGVAVRHLNDAHGSDHGHGHGHTHRSGEVDPHAWQRLDHGIIYATNIANGLAKADPERRAYYQSRAQTYIAQMKKLDEEIRLAFAAIPKDRRKVITSHDAFGYFADSYGIEFISVAGLSNEAEPSAKELARIIDRAKKEGISGVFVENTTSAKLVNQIARETGVKVGGTLYSDALASSDQPGATYLGMFTWNAGQLIYVLTSAPS